MLRYEAYLLRSDGQYGTSFLFSKKFTPNLDKNFSLKSSYICSMITTKTPIGEIINFLYENNDIYKDDSLSKEISDLVDIISIRAKKDGVNKTLSYLEEDLFELRLAMFNETQIFEDITENINQRLQVRIESQFDNNTNHKRLEQAFVNSIDIYLKITENIIDEIPCSRLNSMKNLPQLNYDGFKDLLNSLPGKENQYIISYLRSSIALDFGLILSELIFANKLKIKGSEIENVVILLKNSIEDFAVYSHQFGLWKPADEDESQWMRNIKIRIALFESVSTSNDLTSKEIDKMLSA